MRALSVACPDVGETIAVFAFVCECDVGSEEPSALTRLITHCRLAHRNCARLAQEYQAGGRRLAYALRYTDGHFHPETMELMTTDGRGLTCATFVLAVFASRRQQLVRTEEWPYRAEDTEYQRYEREGFPMTAGQLDRRATP